MNKNFLKQAQQLQARLAKVQQDLEEETIEVTSGGGAIKISMTGKLVVQSIVIDPEAVDPDDVTTLEDLVLTAVNEALQQAQEMASNRMGAITGGMRIPGLM